MNPEETFWLWEVDDVQPTPALVAITLHHCHRTLWGSMRADKVVRSLNDDGSIGTPPPERKISTPRMAWCAECHWEGLGGALVYLPADRRIVARAGEAIVRWGES